MILLTTKALLIPPLLSFALASVLAAQTCREVVRDAIGRVLQTIDRKKSAGGTVQASKRDASGRITGSSASSDSPSGSSSKTLRDASGRIIGSSKGTGKCQDVTKVPVPPPGVKW